MTTPFRAAVVQLSSQSDTRRNLDAVERLVARAREAGATLVALPENFAFIGDAAHTLAIAEPLSEENPGPILDRMRRLAQREGVCLLLGGMPIQSPDPRHCHNACLVLGPDGSLLAHYFKMHLFDVAIPGRAEFSESNHIAPGHEVVVCEVQGAKLGLSVCYDVRFPELYRLLYLRGAEILAIPAAFTLHTGKDHWIPLLRARAIENQAYVLAPAQFGTHEGRRTTFGKSAIIDPWGAVIAQVSDVNEGFATAELDFDFLQKIRDEMPCQSHMRLVEDRPNKRPT